MSATVLRQMCFILPLSAMSIYCRVAKLALRLCRSMCGVGSAPPKKCTTISGLYPLGRSP